MHIDLKNIQHHAYTTIADIQPVVTPTGRKIGNPFKRYAKAPSPVSGHRRQS